MRPQFVTFITCSFDEHWEFFDPAKHTSANLHYSYLDRFTKLICKSHDSAVNLVDSSKREVRMRFHSGAMVGIADGMFYCNSDDVKDTTMGKPMTQ